MKKVNIPIILAVIFTVVIAAQQPQKQKLNPAGSWIFDAPYAPEGYTTGNITIELKEKVYNASISFPSSGMTVPGEKVTFRNDTLNFEVYVDGYIDILLKMESDTSMTGKAMSPEGEIPLTLKRDTAKQ